MLFYEQNTISLYSWFLLVLSCNIFLMTFHGSIFLHIKLGPTTTSSPRRRGRGLHNPDSSNDQIRCFWLAEVRNFTNIIIELVIPTPKLPQRPYAVSQLKISSWDEKLSWREKQKRFDTKKSFWLDKSRLDEIKSHLNEIKCRHDEMSVVRKKLDLFKWHFSISVYSPIIRLWLHLFKRISLLVTPHDVFPISRYYPQFSRISIHLLPCWTLHSCISQVLPQLSCGDTGWTWFEESGIGLCNTGNYSSGEIYERNISMATTIAG